MSRVRLLTSPEDFFHSIQKKTNLTLKELGDICSVHRRSFSDWKNGSTLIPLQVFNKLITLTKIRPPKHFILPENWHVTEAARKGAQRRLELYGALGTPAGRRKGGLKTRALFLSNPDFAANVKFKLRKKIVYPSQSADLAEMIGIILGDGGIAPYQVSITLNSIDDNKYVDYVQNLFIKLFQVRVDRVKARDDKSIDVRISSRELVEYLTREHQFSVGSKIRAQVTIPQWITSRDEFLRACIRGLLDTDGSFYIDQHTINRKVYTYPCLVFTSRNNALYKSVYRGLSHLGLCPTGKHTNIFIRKEDSVHQYFRIIGSSNDKHLAKYRNFVKNKKIAERCVSG